MTAPRGPLLTCGSRNGDLLPARVSRGQSDIGVGGDTRLALFRLVGRPPRARLLSSLLAQTGKPREQSSGVAFNGHHGSAVGV